jgi:hypothetical protein
MSFGQDPYQLYFGTLGGYVMIYDVRYNIMAANYKHITRAPINSLAAFHPARNILLSLNRSDPSSPMVLVAAGSTNFELSLLNLETGAVDVLMTVDDRKDRESAVATLP